MTEHDGILEGSACTRCAYVMYPPRLWCSQCQADVSPVPLSRGEVIDVVSVYHLPGSGGIAPLMLALVHAGPGAKLIAAVRGEVGIGASAEIGAAANATPWVKSRLEPR